MTSEKSASSLLKGRSVLVTGGAGFIGSHVVERLAERGARVTALDNFSTGRRENVAHLESRMALLVADLLDRSVLQEALRGVDAVVHLAAIPSVIRSMKDPGTTHRVNVDGTFGLLDEARRAKVRRVVLASSSSVYGDTPRLPKSEGDMPRPMSPYGASKLAGEAYAQAFHRGYGLETVCLRFFNVFGPRQDPASEYAAVVPKFITSLIKKHPATIYGDGQQTRDFTFVHNVVDAVEAAILRPIPEPLVLNVAAGKQTSVRTLYGLLAMQMGVDKAPKFADPRPGEIMHSVADIRLAHKHLGYEPKVSLEDGLRATVAWYRSLTESKTARRGRK